VERAVMEWDEREGPDRGEAVLAIFQRGAEFTRQLLKENARLRRELGDIQLRQSHAAQSDREWQKLRDELTTRIDELESRNQTILERLRSAEGESRRFAERYRDVEQENDLLANLYVASHQLHSTLDPSEVVRVVLEIVINLVGAEVFAVYLCEEGGDRLEPIAAEGDRIEAFPGLHVGDGFVGRSVAEARIAVAGEGSPGRAPSQGGEPLVSIPLHVHEQPVGAIVIYALLPQKRGLSALDHELFVLLAAHAATAIFASRLYAQSERKLATIQGFIDLLTR
jgi:nitrate/nitrite-specific signal transduction histidine kinase